MSLRSNSNRPLTLFIASAAKDQALRGELVKHLRVLKQAGIVNEWNEHEVYAGADWQAQTQFFIDTADLLLLLLSPDFLLSDGEIQQIMKRYECGDASIIPILLRPVDWSGLPFGRLQSLPRNGVAVTQWQNKDAAFFDVVRGIRQVAEEHLSHTVSKAGNSLFMSTKGTSFWNVPYRRNSFFTGREVILSTLDEYFCRNNESAPYVQAITGLAGVGKTQVALEYVYRHQADYQTILWIKADSYTSLITDAVSIASYLGLLEKSETDATYVLSALRRWLQDQVHWLIIFDSIEDFAIIEMMLPLVANGHVLFTTRSQATGSFAHAHALESMELNEGSLFLLRRSKAITLSASLNEIGEEQSHQARAITQAFGGLPLALDQAGAFIEETGIGLSDYLKLYKQRHMALLKRRGRLVRDHPDSVTTTLFLSFEKVQREHPPAMAFLYFCAFLHPDAIPEALFAEGISSFEEELQTVLADPYEFETLIEALLRLSLIRRNVVTKTLSVHRLIQAVLKDSLSKEQQLRWAKEVVCVINSVFPEANFKSDNWSRSQRYSAQAQMSAELVHSWGMEFREAIQILWKTGTYLLELALYPQAETLITRSIAASEKSLGLDDVDTIQSFHAFGILAFQQCQYERAEQYLIRSLTICERVLGSIHIQTAKICHNLAILYRILGKYSESEELFQRSLTIRRQVLDPGDVEISASLTNLAILYRIKGRYAEAEELYHQALLICEQAQETEGIPIAQVCNNLALLYQTQGKYQEAEAYYRRALLIRERLLGPEL